MASLIEIRDMLELEGRMEASQLSARLRIAPALLNAMLGRLEALGKARRIQEEASGCQSEGCNGCPAGTGCLREWWVVQ